jgi:hypothetical protein
MKTIYIYTNGTHLGILSNDQVNDEKFKAANYKFVTNEYTLFAFFSHFL